MKELLEKLDELETDKFIHKMKDHWNNNDFEYNRKLNREIKELKEQLKALGWEG